MQKTHGTNPIHSVTTSLPEQKRVLIYFSCGCLPTHLRVLGRGSDQMWRQRTVFGRRVVYAVACCVASTSVLCLVVFESRCARDRAHDVVGVLYCANGLSARRLCDEPTRQRTTWEGERCHTTGYGKKKQQTNTAPFLHLLRFSCVEKIVAWSLAVSPEVCRPTPFHWNSQASSHRRVGKVVYVHSTTEPSTQLTESG